MKLFGREPALWLSAIGAALTLAAAFNVPYLDAGQSAAIVAFLTAAVTAFVTRPVAPAVFTGVVAAASALVAEYGLHFSDAQVGAVTATVLALVTLLGVRPQVTPTSDPKPLAVASDSYC